MRKTSHVLIATMGLLFTIALHVSGQDNYPGKLNFEPYKFRTFDGREYDAEIGKLWVKENRNSSSNRLIQLAFVRLKSTAANPGAPIVWLAGGPGVPGIIMGKVPVYFNLFDKLRQVADVILLDQRGTGLSIPNLVCQPANTPRDVFKNDQAWLHALTKATESCARHWRAQGVDLAAYTNEANADDIYDIRKALQVAKISLIGHSYGTVLASTVIQRHSAYIERVVLANSHVPDGLLASPEVWDFLIKKLSYLAKSDTSINKLVPDLEVLYRNLLSRLEKKPILLRVKNSSKNTVDTIVVGKIGLQWIIRNYMADARTYGTIPALLYSIDGGEYDIFSKLLETFYNNVARSAMATAVDCSLGWSPQRMQMVRSEAGGSLFSNVNLQWMGSLCDIVGIPKTKAGSRERIFSIIPTLFISGTLDTNTPPFEAEELRWGFPDSHHLIVTNGGHETLPSPDVQAIVVDFFRGFDVQNRTVKFSRPDFISPEELRRLDQRSR